MRTIAAYASERFPVRLFAPAILLHATIAWWVAGSPLSTLPVAISLIGLLFVQFRLWDDLEDVDRDRVAYADRVLVNSDRRAFRRVLVALLAATFAALAPEATAAGLFAVLLVVFVASYRVIRRWLSDLQWRYRLLLLKYPAFIWIVAARIGEPTAQVAAGAVAAYLAASSYEFWHTRLEPTS